MGRANGHAHYRLPARRKARHHPTAGLQPDSTSRFAELHPAGIEETRTAVLINSLAVARVFRKRFLRMDRLFTRRGTLFKPGSRYGIDPCRSSLPGNFNIWPIADPF
jgi:hypothetical protein